ncbi:MAG: DUF2628 domain-containing protein [Acidobacteriota bacterium]|jgi:hypothetical protein
MMKTISIYQHGQKGFRAVKTGFSWPGFFFMWIWAFTRGLTGTGVLLFLIWLAILGLYMLAVMSALDFMDIVYSFVLFVNAVIVGLWGNSWQANSLLKKGYKHIDTVQASSPRAAARDAVSAAYAQNQPAQEAG